MSHHNSHNNSHTHNHHNHTHTHHPNVSLQGGYQVEPLGRVGGMGQGGDMFSVMQDMNRQMEQIMGGMFGERGRGQVAHRQTSDGQQRSMMSLGMPSMFGGFDSLLNAPFGGLANRLDEFDDGFLNSGFEDPSGGQCFSQVMVSSSKMGADGKMHQENYMRKNVNGRTVEGHKIGQTEEAYKNTENGLKKLSQGRYINDRATKVVKSQTGNGRFSLT